MPSDVPCPSTGYGYGGSEQLLVGDDTEALDHFGEAIALAGGRLVIGAPRDGHSDAPGRGSVYTFTRSGDAWVQRDKLILAAPAATRKARPGAGLTPSDLVVGAEQDTSLPAGAGFWFAASAPAPAGDAGPLEEDAAAAATDAGTEPDAGTTKPSDGCACSVGRGMRAPSRLLGPAPLLALASVWLVRRRPGS